MSPETLPPHDHSPEAPRPRGDPQFGVEAQAAAERALARLSDPDQALRLLSHLHQSGAGFAAYLTLPDTDPAAENIGDRFAENYLDAWEQFAELRRDVLESLGWLDAVNKVRTEQGIPADHLRWNHAAVDKQIFDTYDTIHLDGWWHLFYK